MNDDRSSDATPQTESETASGPSAIEDTFNAAVEFVGSVAEDTGRQVNSVLRDENAQKIAGGAAVGALAAVFLPISLGFGAAVGAGIIAYKRLKKK